MTETSDAMDLPKGLFQRGAQAMAKGVLAAATRSKRRTGTPYQSAMSMLTFYENRAGTNLSKTRKAAVEGAKRALKKRRAR